MKNLISTEKRDLGFQSIFDELFNQEFKTTRLNHTRTLPAVNIFENKDAFLLEFSIPGVSKNELSIVLDHNKLTIALEQKETERKDQNKTIRREFEHNSFKRSFELPNTIDTNAIIAKQNDGILLIELPKKEEAKPRPSRQIKIGE